MTSNNHDHDMRVAARMAFADRRKRLIADWLLSDRAKTSQWALDIADDLRLVNDAEISMMGGLW